MVYLYAVCGRAGYAFSISPRVQPDGAGPGRDPEPLLFLSSWRRAHRGYPDHPSNLERNDMKYISVAEARNLPGLRLVLTAHMPGPWGEAAKAVLSVRQVKFVPVLQAAMEVNDDLCAWTGVRKSPVAVLDA